MRISLDIQPEVYRIRDTAKGAPGKAHLVVSGNVLHSRKPKSPKVWPWGRATVRVAAKEFIANPCVECLQTLDEGFES